MSTKIRLKRFGKKRAPFYRVIVIDSRKARNGEAIEEVGLYHPTREPSVIELNQERIDYWTSVGAQMSDAVKRLVDLNKGKKVKPQPAPLSPEEKIKKAADEAEKAKQAAAKKAEEEKKAAEEAAKAEAEAAAAEAAASAAEATAEAEAPAEGETADAPAEEKPAEDAPAADAAEGEAK
jgi:small subunit ribosomal protein S16